MAAAFYERLSPFERALLWSGGLHAAVFLLGLSWRLFPSGGDIEYMDITQVRFVDDPSKARKAQNPRPGGSLTASPAPKTAPAPVQVPAPAPADVIKPVDTITSAPTPAPVDAVPAKPGAVPTGAETGAGVGGDGFGDGTGGAGEVDLVYLTTLPRLLNKEELLANIQRFYPSMERLAGREGRVVLTVFLDPAGGVRKTEIAGSGGEAFDAAARKVLSEARFSPALVGQKAVAVKIRQTIDFKLE